MADWHKAVVPAIAATTLLWASGAVSSRAEEAVLIPGATVFKSINPIYPIVAASYPSIGLNFHDDPNPQIVDYSQNALASDRAIQDGVAQALVAVRQNNGDVVIIGESMGSMVAWRTAVELANSPDPPPPEDVRVVLIAPPEAGVAEYFKEGTFIPVLNYRVTRIADLPYDTTVVIGEYDGWSDPPDRPWNLVSSANALAGIVYVHGPPSFTADVSGLTPEVDSTTHVTTYLVPTEHLPLTQVFRDVGVPDALVDQADDVLRPVVDAGYVRHDQPGDTRPYLYDGEIHRNVQSQQQARLQSQDRSETEAVQQRREHRSEVRQAVRNELRGGVSATLGQLKARVAAALRPRPAPET
ncbi:alpha/beta fold hydrolase [Mycolicibacterium moriokaense]|nr:alpha/beta fold hydrolase [Mycolicibacterium moriokaense]